MSGINRKNARDLLSHLIAQLSDPPKGYKQYEGLYDNAPTPGRQGRHCVAVRDLIFSSMRDEVFKTFSTSNSMPWQEMIRSNAGDIYKGERGVYLHIIEGRDNKWRFFVGQAEDMSYRVRRQDQNFRYRRDKPSFHHFAMHNSRWDYFFVLAVLPPGPTAAGFSRREQALLLNMLQMWCTLLFSTVQISTMAQWHEYGVKSLNIGRPWFGLNLECPLDKGGPVKYVNWGQFLNRSDDPLANDFLLEMSNRKQEPTQGPGFVFGLMVGAVAAVLIISAWRPRST
ncbi:hypothetical protein N8I77_006871 [Diaporthe amygdali]|uniref:Uncharacterized protein n=1 Tax=Phomopsis amygdali TaxID=1214568 RepID=A0AAD9SHH9_PHOAM|nr:hypothetical protein N8I77_006871 [Diaporthe amygdali]